MPSSECHFDYFGLNHLGWVREVWVQGEPQMARILKDDSILAKIYRKPLFDHARLRELGALPTEYVYFYERTERALANTLKAGTSRGAEIAIMNTALFDALRARRDDPVKVYEAYLAERNGTYFSLEGQGDAKHRNPPTEAALLSGYDKIAVSVLAGDPRTTPARSFRSPWATAATSRACAMTTWSRFPAWSTANGAHPLHVGAPPESVRAMLNQVKAYERATVAAALSGSRDDAIEALALNPLVNDKAIAVRLAEALL